MILDAFPTLSEFLYGLKYCSYDSTEFKCIEDLLLDINQFCENHDECHDEQKFLFYARQLCSLDESLNALIILHNGFEIVGGLPIAYEIIDILFALGDFKQAEQFSSQVLQRIDCSHLRYLYVRALVRQGKFRDVFNILKSLFLKDGMNTSFYKMTIEILVSTDCPIELAEQFSNILSCAPSSKMYQLLYDAIRSDKAGDFEFAYSFYLKYLWLHPTELHILYRIILFRGDHFLDSVIAQRCFELSNCIQLDEFLENYIFQYHRGDFSLLNQFVIDFLVAYKPITLRSFIIKLKLYASNYNHFNNFGSIVDLLSAAFRSYPTSRELSHFYITSFKSILLDHISPSDFEQTVFNNNLLARCCCISFEQKTLTLNGCSDNKSFNLDYSLLSCLSNYVLSYSTHHRIEFKLDHNIRCLEAVLPLFRFNDLYLQIALSYIDLCKHVLALRYLRMIDKSYAVTEVGNAFASCYYILGDVDAASICLKRSLEFTPNNADALNLLSMIYRENGNYFSSIRCLRRALKSNPHHLAAHYNLAQIHKYHIRSRHYTELTSILKQNDFSLPDKINLYYALSKAYKDLGLFARQFEYLLTASQLKLESIRLNSLTNHVSKIVRRNNTFCKLLDKSNSLSSPFISSSHSPDILPIFIVGLPRSGSTLIEQILAASNVAHLLGEFKGLAQSVRKADLKMDGSIFPLTSDSLNVISGNYYQKALQYLQINSFTKGFLVDKMLYNYTFVRLIVESFPRSRILCMRRNPLDIIISNLECNYMEGNLWTYDLDSMIDVYDSYTKFMDRASDAFRDNILNIDYDDFVQSPVLSIDRIADFTGLPFSTEMYSHHLQVNRSRTASHLRARSPVDSRSRSRWKNYKEQLMHCRTRLLGLGYAVD